MRAVSLVVIDDAPAPRHAACPSAIDNAAMAFSADPPERR
jgi:hypothetical protein